MAITRQATHDDVVQIVDLGYVMHEESPRFRGLNWDDQKVADLTYEMISQGGVFVAEIEDGDLVGFMGGGVTESFFGRDIVGYEYALYVLPDYRKGTLGIRLIKDFEAWCKGKGAKQITLGVSAEIEWERTTKLYNKMGYLTKGTLNIKEL